MSERNSGKMPCPICDSDTTVYDTVLSGTSIRRRRRCLNGHRFNTREGRVGDVWEGTAVPGPTNRRVVPIDVDDYDSSELAAEIAATGGDG